MKLKGVKVEGLNVEDIFIPRGEGALHFRARAVADFDPCEALNPRPTPRKGRNRTGELVEMTQEKTFQDALEQYGERRVAWMVLKSLEATEDLEWETVNINDPNTWLNWRTEFLAAGFTEVEIGRIFNGVFAACGLDEAKVQKARDRFLASQAETQAKELSYQKGDQNSIVSGELVNVSE